MIDTILLDPIWITVADGTRLCATIRMPADAAQNPVPALLEYLPYRRRDGTVYRDAILHQFYAEAGYAAVRLDIRGTGDSDGLLEDEYLPQEQLDAVEAIAWIAAQRWCNGRVGMFGISWGGFNALQVAARRPPALGAIITLCSTDDRYRDECHYMGGGLLTNSFGWGMTALQGAAQPPDPEVVGERWREMWRARLDGLRLFAADWLNHQYDDAYWRQGSIADDYSAIEVPVLAIGGWADGYSNAVPRLMENLRCPRKAWIGPWAHAYPHIASPGPAIDFPNESLRWWDHWLKDHPTDVVQDPPYRVFLEDSYRPSAAVVERAGCWVGLDHWPKTAASLPKRLHLSAAHRHLTEGPKEHGVVLVRSPLETGSSFGEWCPYSSKGELASDQRPDDGRSVAFDTAPLSSDFILIGAPVLRLRLTCDRPTGTIAVRLNEVFADGASANVSYGVLNLAHRDGDAAPKPLDAGQWVEVDLALNDIAHRFASGSRIRLALSTGLWPLLWPSPEIAEIQIDCAESSLLLPNANPRPAPPFAPSRPAEQAEVDLLRSEPGVRNLTEDPANARFTVDVVRADNLLQVRRTRTRAARQAVEHYALTSGDCSSARMEIKSNWSLERPGWAISTGARLELASTSSEFVLSAELTAREGGQTFAERRFTYRIPRRLV